MSNELLTKCREHNTTGADSCPECDRELGKGCFEERYLRIKVKVEVSFLKGLEWRDGRESNVYSDTDPGWDDLAIEIDRVIRQHLSPYPEVKIRVDEWE